MALRFVVAVLDHRRISSRIVRQVEEILLVMSRSPLVIEKTLVHVGVALIGRILPTFLTGCGCFRRLEFALVSIEDENGNDENEAEGEADADRSVEERRANEEMPGVNHVYFER